MMEADVQGVSQTTEHDGSLGAHPHLFAAEEQQKLDEKANQAEDEVESHVDEANKVQMVKKCQMRRCSKQYIRFRLQRAESP